MIHFDRSVHFGRSERNVPSFLFDTIVVLSIALPYPAYKHNNQTHGVSVEVCAIGLRTWNFRKFKAVVFVEWKAPFGTRKSISASGRVSGRTKVFKKDVYRLLPYSLSAVSHCSPAFSVVCIVRELGTGHRPGTR